MNVCLAAETATTPADVYQQRLIYKHWMQFHSISPELPAVTPSLSMQTSNAGSLIV